MAVSERHLHECDDVLRYGFHGPVVRDATQPAHRLLLRASPDHCEPADVSDGRFSTKKRADRCLGCGGSHRDNKCSRRRVSVLAFTRSASPDNATDPYGYQIGNQYTLRWGAPGNNTNCGTDATKPNLATNGATRGYCCVQQSAATLRKAIVGGDTDPMAVSSPVEMDNGHANKEMTAIAWRVLLDTDTTSSTYAQYRTAGNGNGERVVMVPVNGGPPNFVNLGFAGFFLLNANYYASLHGTDSACAEYIGRFLQGAPNPLPPGGSGAFHIKLYQ